MKREMKMRGKGKAAALMTLEAALLMSLILPLLAGIMVSGFYLHDRAYLQAVCTELSFLGSDLMLYSDREAQLDRTEEKRTSNALMWARTAECDHTAGDIEADAGARAGFHVPGLIAEVFPVRMPEISVSWKRNIYHPAELIWTVRSVKYTLDLLQE